MLSILLPIYNFDIRPLVRELHQQCESLGIGYELLCFDDGSSPTYKLSNKEVWKLPNLIYREMPKNLGRSAIRNALGKAARFDYLLFLDCDSRVVSPLYIKYYIDHLDPQKLVYGGRCYAIHPPKDPALYFHWHYGKNREQQPAAVRNHAPYHSFMTNNFLVPRAIFLDILFDEDIRQYGHEDTLFGMELAHRKVPIIHIDNPLEHIGLEPVDVFLQKTNQGIQNLLRLQAQGKPIETKLLTTYLQLKQWKLDSMAGMVAPIVSPVLIKLLKSGRPSLKLFDLYKLMQIVTKENGI